MENRSTSSSMPTQFLLLEEVQFLKVKDESLLQWELVNVLDAEEVVEEGKEDVEDDDDDDGDSVRNGFGSWDSSISWSVSSPKDSPIEEGIHCSILHAHPDADVEDHDHHDIVIDVDAHDDGHVNDGDDADGHAGGRVDDEDEDEDEDEDDGDGDHDGYDLDDELVPWNVSNKFGRQRMRKLGKRAFSKMNNSKRSPYLFVRPGCVRGKHGLGLKHNY